MLKRQNTTLKQNLQTLEEENNDHIAAMEKMKQQIEEQKVAIRKLEDQIDVHESYIDYYQEVGRQDLQTICEQQTKSYQQQTNIEKLVRRIARMEGSEKIQEEIIALKAKRIETEKKIQEEIRALEAARAKADEELEDREEELEMAGEENSEDDQ